MSASSSEASVLQPDDIILAIGALLLFSALRMPTRHMHLTIYLPQCQRPSAACICARRLAILAPHFQVNNVLSTDGVNVGNDGTVPFRHGERVDFK